KGGHAHVEGGVRCRGGALAKNGFVSSTPSSDWRTLMEANSKTAFDSQASYKPTFESYAQKYPHVHMERRDGTLELRLHTDDGSAIWGPGIHEELGYLFADV